MENEKISDYKCPECKSEMTVHEFYEYNTHKCTKCDYFGDVKVRKIGYEAPYHKIFRNLTHK